MTEPQPQGVGVSRSLLGAVGKGFGLSGHQPGVLCSHLARGHFPTPKPFGRVPLPKQGCSWEHRKAAPHFGVSPALLWSQECGSTPQTSGLNSPLEGGKAGMGEGKVLVKVYELGLGSGDSAAAATRTCLTTQTGIKTPIPCPRAWTGGFIPRETPEGMGHQPGEGQPALRVLSLSWSGIRSGLGEAGSGQHPPLG